MQSLWKSTKGGLVKQWFMGVLGYSWQRYCVLGCCYYWTNCNHWAFHKRGAPFHMLLHRFQLIFTPSSDNLGIQKGVVAPSKQVLTSSTNPRQTIDNTTEMW